MKADITRKTFRKKKHYRKVNMQQGRVQIDSDWNEQIDIQVHHDRTSLGDIIGSTGAPNENAGFAIIPSDHGYKIGVGRYYVDGILCENEEEVEATNQPDLPPFGALSAIPTEPGIYLAYLDVREWHRTHLDDDYIREKALGGPDTSTRTKIVWQVKLLRVDTETSNEENYNCLYEFNSWKNLEKLSSGKLQARAEKPKPTAEVCELPSEAGYTKLENHLYRVEIHHSGILGNGATFKWSRDNGIVVTKITKIDGDKLTVEDAGRDRNLGFKKDQWVEIIDDMHELWGIQGTVVKLIDVDEKEKKLVFDPNSNPYPAGSPNRNEDVTMENFPSNPKVRRWDSVGLINVETPSSNYGYIELEAGVQVKFSDGTYRTGDYWLIPARTVTRDIEWPKNGEEPDERTAEGIKHHFARLALLDYENQTFTLRSDCREFFPSITDLMTLHYVSGDGQEAKPDYVLPYPLMVGVSVGKIPIDKTPLQKAKIRFKITGGQGTLDPTAPNKVTERILDTGANGLVIFDQWKLEDKNPNQQVEAVLLDANNNPIHLPLYFNATIRRPAGLSATTGIISFTPKELSQSNLFGPFKHYLPSINTPPAILLGKASDDGKVVEFMEDYSLYNFNKWLPHFKAVCMGLENFMIRIESGIADVRDLPLQLRWWAIPAEEKVDRQEVKAVFPPTKIEFDPPILIIGDKNGISVRVELGKSKDLDIEVTDKIEVELITYGGGKKVASLPLLLIETGSNTRIFERRISSLKPNTIRIKDKGKDIPFNGIIPGNIIEVVYPYVCIENKAVAIITEKGESIAFTYPTSHIGHDFVATIYSPVRASEFPIKATNLRTGETFELIAVKTAEPGIFKASLKISETATDSALKILNAKDNDTIEFTYQIGNKTIKTSTVTKA